MSHILDELDYNSEEDEDYAPDTAVGSISSGDEDDEKGFDDSMEGEIGVGKKSKKRGSEELGGIIGKKRKKKTLQEKIEEGRRKRPTIGKGKGKGKNGVGFIG